MAILNFSWKTAIESVCVTKGPVVGRRKRIVNIQCEVRGSLSLSFWFFFREVFSYFFNFKAHFVICNLLIFYCKSVLNFYCKSVSLCLE